MAYRTTPSRAIWFETRHVPVPEPAAEAKLLIYRVYGQCVTLERRPWGTVGWCWAAAHRQYFPEQLRTSVIEWAWLKHPDDVPPGHREHPALNDIEGSKREMFVALIRHGITAIVVPPLFEPPPLTGSVELIPGPKADPLANKSQALIEIARLLGLGDISNGWAGLNYDDGVWVLRTSEGEAFFSSTPGRMYPIAGTSAMAEVDVVDQLDGLRPLEERRAARTIFVHLQALAFDRGAMTDQL